MTEGLIEDLRITTVTRTGRIRISVNGRKTNASKGETVLAALLAAGYRVLRKDKNGHVRGAFCGMGICYDCLVTINGIGNMRSCMVEHGDMDR